MYINKSGTVLISTVIILSLISILGTFVFKMIKNNNELAYIYNFNGDIYNLQEKEELVLNNFMNELNNIDLKEKEVFEESFTRNMSDNALKYDKDTDKLFLITNKNEEIIRKREIKYIFKNEKIMLIPTYKFKDEQV